MRAHASVPRGGIWPTIWGKHWFAVVTRSPPKPDWRWFIYYRSALFRCIVCTGLQFFPSSSPPSTKPQIYIHNYFIFNSVWPSAAKKSKTSRAISNEYPRQIRTFSRDVLIYLPLYIFMVLFLYFIFYLSIVLVLFLYFFTIIFIAFLFVVFYLRFTI